MAYWQSKGLPRGGKKTQPNPYKWCKTTIRKILSQQEYCGDVINFKTCSKSFKNKTRFPNAPENWAIFKDVHEPIIARDDFEKVQMRVARVLDCQRVEKSEKLLKFRLSLGDEERTVLSGIAKFHNPEDLIGKNLILLANLAPRKIMGIESQGMLLSSVAKNDDGTETLRLLTADPIMPAGAEIG